MVESIVISNRDVNLKTSVKNKLGEFFNNKI